jgi:threonine aldolase
MIDLRSDTLTRPTPGMRAAMAAAEVGDDVYAEDPTVNAFEAKVAALFGKEAGLFVATGTMSNLLGVHCLVPPGKEVICDVRAHIVRAELGGHAANHGVTTRTWYSADGVASADDIARIISPDAGSHLVSTAAVEIENTHNFGGGTVQPLDTLQEISQLCHDAGVAMHLDGARIWNAHIATGVPLHEYGRLFDTVSVCFSKGLGAPVGSMLLASAEHIAKARVQRKRLGGGWRQAGVLAAAADYAVTHQLARLADDHAAAKAFAAEVAARAPEALGAESVQTNIVVLDTGSRPAAEVVAAAKAQAVLLSQVGARTVRAVTHLDVAEPQARQAGQQVAEILADPTK